MKKQLCVLLPAVPAGPVCAGPARAAEGGWDLALATEKGLVFHDVESVGPGDTWFLGGRGAEAAIRHWDGAGFRDVPVPRAFTGTLVDSDFASARQGWAAGTARPPGA